MKVTTQQHARVQFVSLCNLQNVLHDLPGVRFWVRVRVGLRVRVGFRQEIC